MRKVKTNFLIYRWIEIGAFIAGLILIMSFPEPEPGRPFGLALELHLH